MAYLARPNRCEPIPELGESQYSGPTTTESSQEALMSRKRPPQTLDFSRIKRVLIIKLRHHGDVLITSPMFSTLKRQHPHLEVDALVYSDTAAMLEEHPQLNQLHRIDRHWKHLGLKGQISAEWSLLKQLKDKRYDLILHMTDHWRGLTLVKLLKPSYSITQCHVMRQGKFWKNTFDYNYPINYKKRHMVEKHLDALRHVGLYPDTNDKRMVAKAGSSAEAAVSEKLKNAGLAAGGYIHIHPTSRWLFKSWDTDKVAQLIDRLAEQGHKIVLTAAPSEPEMAMIEEILSKVTQTVTNFCGQLSLKELMALIQQAKLLIGVDSVPMHIASATDTPCLAFFGPSNELEWSPWMNQHTILSSDHSCRPCDLAGCGDGRKSECMSAIPVTRALQAVNELLQSSQPVSLRDAL